MGPSGCGKSTAMGIAAGLTLPSAGRVLVDGRAVRGPGPERGVIFQQYALFPWLTVRRNVEFGLEIAGRPRAERRATAERFIDLVGLICKVGRDGERPERAPRSMDRRTLHASSYAAHVPAQEDTGVTNE